MLNVTNTSEAPDINKHYKHIHVQYESVSLKSIIYHLISHNLSISNNIKMVMTTINDRITLINNVEEQY